MILAAAALAGCGRQENADQPLPAAEAVASAPMEAQTTTDPNDPSSAPPISTSTANRPARKPRSTTPKASQDVLSPADRISFARLQTRLGGRIGLAVSGLGEGQKVQRLGSLDSVIAWSTSKVPIAMAVYDAGLADSQRANLRAAITASDNAAAERLWAALGGGTQAAAGGRRPAARPPATITPRSSPTGCAARLHRRSGRPYGRSPIRRGSLLAWRARPPAFRCWA